MTCAARVPGCKLRRARRAAWRGQTCCRAAQARAAIPWRGGPQAGERALPVVRPFFKQRAERAATGAAFAAAPRWASCRGCWTPLVLQSRSAKCSAWVSTTAASRPSYSISSPTKRFAAPTSPSRSHRAGRAPAQKMPSCMVCECPAGSVSTGMWSSVGKEPSVTPPAAVQQMQDNQYAHFWRWRVGSRRPQAPPTASALPR